MYTFVSGIEEVSRAQEPLRMKSVQRIEIVLISSEKQIREDDAICIPCYDDLKIAHHFKQKCIQSNLLQKSDASAAKNCGMNR